MLSVVLINHMSYANYTQLFLWCTFYTWTLLSIRGTLDEVSVVRTDVSQLLCKASDCWLVSYFHF